MPIKYQCEEYWVVLYRVALVCMGGLLCTCEVMETQHSQVCVRPWTHHQPIYHG